MLRGIGYVVVSQEAHHIFQQEFLGDGADGGTLCHRALIVDVGPGAFFEDEGDERRERLRPHRTFER